MKWGNYFSTQLKIRVLRTLTTGVERVFLYISLDFERSSKKIRKMFNTLSVQQESSKIDSVIRAYN